MSFGSHSAVHPFGPQAARIAAVWWLMFWVSAAVFVLVVAFLLGAVFRSPSSRERSAARAGGEKRMGAVVAGAAIATAVVLVAFLVVDVSAGRALATTAAPPLSIQVVGHQWWWEVHYPDAAPSQAITTANEIHIPVGRPVEFELASRDVIHSFWAPSLHGKKDLIPGHGSRLLVQADQPGMLHGQCAEFCGLQHANMAFLVVAQPPARFRAWLRAESRPARAGGAGRRVFESVGCGDCHTIRGTAAKGSVGPDLTHLASRMTLAANTIPNDAGSLAGWILDPQHVKPGNRMPGLDLTGGELGPLLDYLRGLR
jgi:cytochrome c oxidase subunit II